MLNTIPALRLNELRSYQAKRMKPRLCSVSLSAPAIASMPYCVRLQNLILFERFTGMWPVWMYSMEWFTIFPSPKCCKMNIVLFVRFSLNGYWLLKTQTEITDSLKRHLKKWLFTNSTILSHTPLPLASIFYCKEMFLELDLYRRKLDRLDYDIISGYSISNSR